MKNYLSEQMADPYKMGNLEGRVMVVVASLAIGAGEAKAASSVSKVEETAGALSKVAEGEASSSIKINLQLLAKKGNNTYQSASKLTDGMTMNTNTALDEASAFLGKEYKEMGGGRFVSADGTKQVRLGNSDILGQHGGAPHFNFETLVPNPAKLGKMIVDTNLYIFIK